MPSSSTSFFWKFSKSGKHRKVYNSLIIDVPLTSDNFINQDQTWLTTFDSLSMILLLIQDIEKINQKNLLDYQNKINELRYIVDDKWKPKRNKFKLVHGRAKIGNFGDKSDHKFECTNKFIFRMETDIRRDYFRAGFYLCRLCEWGYYESSDNSRIELPVFDNTRHYRGRAAKKLDCYRNHDEFIVTCSYWDFMPLHMHIPIIFNAMKNHDPTKADEFVREILGWSPI